MRLRGGMIGGGRIRVSGIFLPVSGVMLILSCSGCGGGGDPEEYQRCSQFESLCWDLASRTR